MEDQRVAGVAVGQHQIMRGVVVQDEEISVSTAVEPCDGPRKIMIGVLSVEPSRCSSTSATNKDRLNSNERTAFDHRMKSRYFGTLHVLM